MRTSKVAALVVVSGKPSAATLKKQRIMSAAAAHLACVVWADDAAVIQLFACIKSEISSMTCFFKTWDMNLQLLKAEPNLKASPTLHICSSSAPAKRSFGTFLVESFYGK